jgi:peroxiredoxin
MPALIDFAKQHQKEGLVLLPVDVQDEEVNAKNFMRAQNMTMPVLFDPAGSVFPVLGANALPATFFVDRRGAIRFAWVGPLSPASLDSRVKPLLSQ